MGELENLLLEAAGRTGRNQHSTPSSRRQRKGSYSDDGSDYRSDDSDNNRSYANRKPSGPPVPLKKRLESSEHDDEHSSSSPEDDDDDDDDDDRRYKDDSDNDSYGSDLYKDEEDKKKLAKMSELEREMILSERADKKNDKDLKNNIKKQKEKSNARKVNSPPHSRKIRSSTRALVGAGKKDDALQELRARKKRREQDPDSSHYKRRESESTVKRKSTTALSRSSHSESGTRSEEDEESTGGGDSEDGNMSKDSSVLKFEDIKGITIRRSKLSKWFMEPFFEELIVGCFVRVGIGKSKSGPIYRLCIVRNVDAADPDRQYKLENKMTHKYLNVVWGNENSAARWQMAMISDSPPVKDEFEQLMREVDRHGGRMPSKQEVAEKREAIDKTNTFVYSAETVKQMLQEKKSTIRRPLNVAAEKDKLRRDMEVAQMKHDEVEVERIKGRLLELEASRETQQKDKKAIRLAEMNRKNRVENFKNASEVKPMNIGLKAGEAGYDPFSRRWTRSRNYYVSKGGEVAAEEVAAEVAMEEAEVAGKLVDRSGPMEEGREAEMMMMHDFEVPISLALLQRFGGPHGVQAGFMARKQRIEATVGCQVPENDGRRHALTLSVSDYKRRRGLL